MTTDATVLLSDSDIAVLNLARTVLGALERRVDHNSRMAEVAHSAESAVFRVLNVTHSYGHQPMTAQQLHNGPLSVVPEEAPVPA